MKTTNSDHGASRRKSGFIALTFLGVFSIANAKIITPATVTRNDNLSLGYIRVSASKSGNVTLIPVDNRTVSVGGVMVNNSDKVEAASFTINGQPGYAYSITLPEKCDITDEAGDSIQVSSFTSYPSGSGILNEQTGMQTVRVGATIHVAAGQAEGKYENSGTAPITINYN